MRVDRDRQGHGAEPSAPRPPAEIAENEDQREKSIGEVGDGHAVKEGDGLGEPTFGRRLEGRASGAEEVAPVEESMGELKQAVPSDEPTAERRMRVGQAWHWHSGFSAPSNDQRLSAAPRCQPRREHSNAADKPGWTEAPP